jgi:hypothetical protein
MKGLNRKERLLLACCLGFLLQSTACAQQKASTAPKATTDTTATSIPAKPAGAVFKDVPEIDPSARYLIYLHGRIIEEKGLRPTDPRYGIYEYEEILKTLAGKGFTVISEPRPKGTDVKKYATKVVGQINALIKAGMPASNVTVVGASKGSMIAMLVSTYLKNKNANFVLMSNCNDWVLENYELDLYGNVLSIYDVNDAFGATCGKFFERATGLNRHHEIELKVGTGHAILYKPLKEWVDPVVDWANQP